MTKKKKGKRRYLNVFDTKDFMKQLNHLFNTTIKIPRMKIGKRQIFETLVNEEALFLGKFLRIELKKCYIT